MRLRDGIATHVTLASAYARLVDTGAIVADPAQRPVVQALDRLIEDLASERVSRKSSALGWLFAKRTPRAAGVKGLYIHGGVGRGKTMLMDLFFDLAPAKRKRRVHFNDFMAEVHDRIQEHRRARREGRSTEDDPIPPVAREIASGSHLLCFDEFTVTDIADAMILSRLFSALFAEGVVLVATSNVAPDDLYRDGLNRGLFLPFIDVLRKHTAILSLESDTDWRMAKLRRMPVYLTPLDDEAERLMDEAWQAGTQGRRVGPETVAVMGREIVVPAAAGDAARFSFADLCDAPLGARDYLALTDRYVTFFVEGVPVLDQTRRNATKRFILLVDTLYDRRRRLVVTAEAPPDRLYAGRAGVTEAFEFDRTVSRLVEMQSADWAEAAREDTDA
jgi:cell division protein ZapE